MPETSSDSYKELTIVLQIQLRQVLIDLGPAGVLVLQIALAPFLPILFPDLHRADQLAQAALSDEDSGIGDEGKQDVGNATTTQVPVMQKYFLSSSEQSSVMTADYYRRPSIISTSKLYAPLRLAFELDAETKEEVHRLNLLAGIPQAEHGWDETDDVGIMMWGSAAQMELRRRCTAPASAECQCVSNLDEMVKLSHTSGMVEECERAISDSILTSDERWSWKVSVLEFFIHHLTDEVLTYLYCAGFANRQRDWFGVFDDDVETKAINIADHTVDEIANSVASDESSPAIPCTSELPARSPSSPPILTSLDLSHITVHVFHRNTWQLAMEIRSLHYATRHLTQDTVFQFDEIKYLYAELLAPQKHLFGIEGLTAWRKQPNKSTATPSSWLLAFELVVEQCLVQGLGLPDNLKAVYNRRDPFTIDFTRSARLSLELARACKLYFDKCSDQVLGGHCWGLVPLQIRAVLFGDQCAAFVASLVKASWPADVAEHWRLMTGAEEPVGNGKIHSVFKFISKFGDEATVRKCLAEAIRALFSFWVVDVELPLSLVCLHLGGILYYFCRQQIHRTIGLVVAPITFEKVYETLSSCILPHDMQDDEIGEGLTLGGFVVTSVMVWIYGLQFPGKGVLPPTTDPLQSVSGGQQRVPRRLFRDAMNNLLVEQVSCQPATRMPSSDFFGKLKEHGLYFSGWEQDTESKRTFFKRICRLGSVFLMVEPKAPVYLFSASWEETESIPAVVELREFFNKLC